MSVAVPTAAEFAALVERVSRLERGASSAERGVIAEPAQLPALVRRGEVHAPTEEPSMAHGAFGVRPSPALHLWHPCPEAEATHRAIGEHMAAPYDYVDVVPFGYERRARG